MKVILILFALLNFLLAEEEKYIDQKSFDSALNEVTADMEIWWVAPMNTKWDKFKFIKLDNKRSKEVLSYFKDAKFDLNADTFNLMDVPFDKYSERTPGFFVIKLSDAYLGFRLRDNRINSKGFGFVKIINFNPDKNIIEWNFEGVAKMFSGVIWNVDPSIFIVNKVLAD